MISAVRNLNRKMRIAESRTVMNLHNPEAVLQSFLVGVVQPSLLPFPPSVVRPLF